MKNVYAINCPAEAIREYIELIPEGMKVPEEIEISKENVKFLLNSKLVSFYGTGENPNEFKFFWKSDDTYPALEVDIIKRDGKFYLTYIKEEASMEKPAFEWNAKETLGKKGKIIVSKKSDALEDIVDMDEYSSKKI